MFYFIIFCLIQNAKMKLWCEVVYTVVSTAVQSDVKRENVCSKLLRMQNAAGTQSYNDAMWSFSLIFQNKSLKLCLKTIHTMGKP